METAASNLWPVLGMVPSSGLLFGLMLVAAIVGGYSARLVHVPRVVGFLLGGLALRAMLHGLLVPDDGDGSVANALQSAAAPLKAIKDLALGLILFTIGSVFERSRLRTVGARVLKIGVLEIGLVVLLVFVVCGVVALITQSHYGFSQNLVLAALLAAAGIATAPAATLFVLHEYEAKGPITNTVLGVTGLNNVVCIGVFYSTFLVLASCGVVSTSEALSEHLWLALASTTLGSAALGIICGTLISIIHAKLPLSETLLIFFALFIVLGAGEGWLLEHYGTSFNFLLTALVIGGVFANLAINSQKLESSLKTVGGPIFAGFFVMAGYDLHLSELAHMGWLGGAYVLARSAGKILGGRIGVRWAKSPQRAGDRLGTTLLCQAAVVIGLASFVTVNWHSELARQFNTIILGSVVVFELVGPLLIKRCVVLGGEVKLTSLLRRTGRAAEGGGIVRLTLRSLLRLFGIQIHRAAPGSEAMNVSKIMRTNVQFVHASDGLDDVLQFIERSTYNHFTVVDDDDEFVGVIHFSDVRDVIYDPAMRELVTAIDLADPSAKTVPMDMTLDELLEVFGKQNVGVLPVVESPECRHIVGVVEQRDLLRTLHLSRISG